MSPNPFATRPAPSLTFHSEEASPFLVELLRLPDQSDKSTFTPGVRLLVTRTLRTSGLLAALPENDVKTLLTLLTFLHPNGHCQASVPELTGALSLSEAKVRARMERLGSMVFQDQPVVRLVRRESGLDSYVLSSAVLGQGEPVEGAPLALPVPPKAPGSSVRERVYAHSREAYARPRQEVERIVEEQLGHAPQEQDDTPEGAVRRRLAALGVARDQADLLLANHALDEIVQQLDWLPHRHAKSPARFVVAAVTNRYAPPVGWQPGKEEHGS